TLPYDQNLVTRDEPTRTWIAKDPEGRFRLPGKYLLELLKLSNATKNKAKSLKTPVFMLTAGHDKIVSSTVNQNFYNSLTSPTKQSRHFKEAWHDLMFDPQVDEVAEAVVHWMSEHTVERLLSS